jgi:TRAP-type C4-dicarboxylate transport system substrate-binding protein
MLRGIGRLVAAACMLVAGAATAQTKWDMATPYNDSQYHTQNIRWFADEVKKATNGQLELVVHSNASLLKMPDILRAVQSGQVNAGEILLSAYGNEDPMLEVDSVPFFAVGYDEAEKLYGVQRAYLEDRLGKRGIRLLYSVPWPGQALWSKNPLNRLADYKGVKFRAYNPITAKLGELMGAVPTTVQLSELGQAFATNIVTAMITSAPGGTDAKAWEYAKYFYDTKAFLPKNAVLVNDRAFRRLPEAQQKAILDLAAQAEKRGWMLSKETEGSATKKLADNGMTIVKPEPALMNEFKGIGDQMLKDWLQKAGPDGEALVKKFRG